MNLGDVDKLEKDIKKRKAAYKAVFDGAQAEIVLKDLARFCRAVDSSFDENPYKMAYIEGRREVYLRILTHIDQDIRPTSKLINQYEGEYDYD